MLKKVKQRIEKSIWLYPTIYTLLALLLSFLVIAADSGRWISLDQNIAGIFLTNKELAQEILKIAAASLITITTFTFSTTMVVLTLYSSQFSPRTVENFLADQNTMKALGVFMSGFVYSVVTLLFVRDAMVNSLVIAGTVAVIYLLVCLIRFTMYIHHVGSFIQTKNLVERLNQEARLRIDEYEELLEKGKRMSDIRKVDTTYRLRVKSNQPGYIQFVEYQALAEIGDKIEAIIIFEKVIGQYVTDETEIFSVCFLKEPKEDEGLPDRLRSLITIDKERTELQDFNFTIQKIVEISLRAISPGINDPNTAIHCLRIIGVLLSSLAVVDPGFLRLTNDQEKEAGIAFELIDFEKELYATYSQIIHYGKQDVSVMISLVKSLRFIAEKASFDNFISIVRFLDYLWEKVDDVQMAKMDMQKLKHEKDEILALKELRSMSLSR